MPEFPINVLEGVCEGQLMNASGEEYISGVSIDSRKVKPGYLFVAIPGENFDGHDFAEAAFGAGAVCVLMSRTDLLPANRPVLLVKDTLVALQKLASWWRQQFSLPIVGVTGSSGKTTTKDILSSLVSVGSKVHSNSGNFNNELGVPLTLLGLEQEHQVCVLEMAMRGPGEIAELCEIAKPTSGIITNVGMTHFERLGSEENIARAKGELAEAVPPEGFVVINADSKWHSFLSQMAKAETVSFGLRENAQVRAQDVDFDREGTAFTLKAFGHSQRLRSPLWGEHNVYNTLAAAAAYIMLGLPREGIQEGLSKVSITKMRLEKTVGANKSTIINDSYNANPSSMLASLEVLKQIGGSRTIAVLGDMFELGEIEVQEHRRVGAGVCQLGIDLLITVGELAANISEEAVACGMPKDRAFHMKDLKEAGDLLLKIIHSGDVVLVKGSRGMKMEGLVEALCGEKAHV